jgi:hypothetical protein
MMAILLWRPDSKNIMIRNGPNMGVVNDDLIVLVPK